MDDRQNTFFARYSRWIIALALAVLPLALAGALITMGTNRNDVKEWLPESFEETQEYHRFEREFSNDTFIEASWEGCTLDDPRLGRNGHAARPRRRVKSASRDRLFHTSPDGRQPGRPADQSAGQFAAGRGD